MRPKIRNGALHAGPRLTSLTLGYPALQNFSGQRRSSVGIAFDGGLVERPACLDAQPDRKRFGSCHTPSVTHYPYGINRNTPCEQEARAVRVRARLREGNLVHREGLEPPTN